MTKQYTLEDLQGLFEQTRWLNEHEAKWLLDYAESLKKRNADQAQVIAGLLQDKANFSLCQQAASLQSDPDDYQPTAEEYEDALAGTLDDIAHARDIVEGFYNIVSMSTGVAGYGQKDEAVDWGQFESLLCKADDWLAAHPDDAQEGRGY